MRPARYPNRRPRVPEALRKSDLTYGLTFITCDPSLPFAQKELEKTFSWRVKLNIMIFNLKLPPSVQQFVKNFLIGVQIQCNMITCSLSLSFVQQVYCIVWIELVLLISPEEV